MYAMHGKTGEINVISFGESLDFITITFGKAYLVVHTTIFILVHHAYLAAKLKLVLLEKYVFISNNRHYLLESAPYCLYDHSRCNVAKVGSIICYCR